MEYTEQELNFLRALKQKGVDKETAFRELKKRKLAAQSPTVSGVLDIAGGQIEEKRREIAPVKQGMETLAKTSPTVRSTLVTAGKAVEAVGQREEAAQKPELADATFYTGSRAEAEKALAEPTGLERAAEQFTGGLGDIKAGFGQLGEAAEAGTAKEYFAETGAGLSKTMSGAWRTVMGPVGEVIKSAPGGEAALAVLSSPFAAINFIVDKAYEAAGYDINSEEYQTQIKAPITEAVNIAGGVYAPKVAKDIGGKIRPLAEKVGQKLETLLGNRQIARYTKTVAKIENSLSDFIKTNQAVQRKVDEIKQSGTDVVPILSDPNVFSLLKAEKGSLVVDSAVDFIQNRIDKAMAAKGKFLPLADKLTKPVANAELLQRTIGNIKDQGFLLANELKKIREAEALLAPEPASMSLKYLDQLRAKARKSAVDAKGALKSDSVYTAINDAARDLVFEKTDALPIGESGAFGNLNKLIKDDIQAIKFLNKTLKGKKVKNARLGQMLNKVTGAVIGSAMGPLGAVIGSEMAGLISAIIMDRQLGGAVKKGFIRELLPDNPKVIEQVEAMIDEAQSYAFPELPAPAEGAFRKTEVSGDSIPLGSKSPSTIEGEEVAKFGFKESRLRGLKDAEKRDVNWHLRNAAKQNSSVDQMAAIASTDKAGIGNVKVSDLMQKKTATNGQELYHGSFDKLGELRLNKGGDFMTDQPFFSLTDNKEIANVFTTKKDIPSKYAKRDINKVNTFTAKDLKILDASDFEIVPNVSGGADVITKTSKLRGQDLDIAEAIVLGLDKMEDGIYVKQLLESGYDGIKFPAKAMELADGELASIYEKGNEIRIFNEAALKKLRREYRRASLSDSR